MVTLHGHLVLKVPMLRCSSREGACQKDKARKPKKKKKSKRGLTDSSSFAAQLFAVSLIHAFVKTGRPPGPQKRHSYPAALYSQKGFLFFVFLKLPSIKTRTLRVWEVKRKLLLLIIIVTISTLCQVLCQAIQQILYYLNFIEILIGRYILTL